MTIEASKISEECKINSIIAGSLRGYSIVKISCNNLNAEVDIPDELLIFKENENIKFLVVKDKPQYTNKDFCAHGYLFYERKDKDEYISLISLYGLIVKITTKEGLIASKKFNMMDHVYLCLKH
ncbi:MAG: DNA-directed RNA polymerase subunit G [Sulfolobaceae archaeon]